MRTALIVAAALVSIQAPSEAQSRIVDEGSFTITTNGRTVGRENFRISAVPRGDVTDYLARADVTFGDRRMNVELRTGPEGEVVEVALALVENGVTRLSIGSVVAGEFGTNTYSDAATAVLPGFEKPRGFSF
jgi:hypothetical protein